MPVIGPEAGRPARAGREPSRGPGENRIGGTERTRASRSGFFMPCICRAGSKAVLLVPLGAPSIPPKITLQVAIDGQFVSVSICGVAMRCFGSYIMARNIRYVVRESLDQAEQTSSCARILLRHRSRSCRHERRWNRDCLGQRHRQRQMQAVLSSMGY